MAEITRSEFLKGCAVGACSCSLVALSATGTAAALSADTEMDALKAQREAIRIRYAKLLGILDEEVDAATRKRIFDRLGRVWGEPVPISSARSPTTNTRAIFVVFLPRSRLPADGSRRLNTTRRRVRSASSIDRRPVRVLWSRRGSRRPTSANAPWDGKNKPTRPSWANR